MNFDDEAPQGEEQSGSDELLSGDNLRLPEGASILVRLHALRAWLARRRDEASLEIGAAAFALQQMMEGEQQEVRRRRERERFAERLLRAQAVFQAAQESLQAYEEAGELLEECISHTTTGARLLAEYYLALEELVQEAAAEVGESDPRLRALYDVQQRIERVGVPHED